MWFLMCGCWSVSIWLFRHLSWRTFVGFEWIPKAGLKVSSWTPNHSCMLSWYCTFLVHSGKEVSIYAKCSGKMNEEMLNIQCYKGAYPNPSLREGFRGLPEDICPDKGFSTWKCEAPSSSLYSLTEISLIITGVQSSYMCYMTLFMSWCMCQHNNSFFSILYCTAHYGPEN